MARCVAFGFGAALLVGCTVRLFTDSASISIAALIAGGFLVLVPLIVDRLESLAAGPAGIKLQLVRQMADLGAPHSAELLRTLGLGREINQYALIYSDLAGSANKNLRASLLDKIVARVAAASAVEKFDAKEVKTLFANGTPVMRVLALGLMAGDISLTDGDVLLEAVRGSLTGNEQYHALKLTARAWNRLAEPERAALRRAIENDTYIAPESDRMAVVQQIRALPGY